MAHCPLCREPVSRASLLTLPRPHRFSVDLSDASQVLHPNPTPNPIPNPNPNPNPKPNPHPNHFLSQWRSSAKIDALLAHLRATLPLALSAPPSPGAAIAAAAAAAIAAAAAAAAAAGVAGEAAGSGGEAGGGADAGAVPVMVPVKSVVFSQWSAMLDLVGVALRREPQLQHVRLDGSMSAEERRKALRRFREERGVRVLLVSLKAGGVGLNLTCATRVYLLDPWWNPAVEDQACD